MTNLKLISVFVLLLSFSISVFPQIPRLVPEAYWGNSFVNGNPAPAGSKITVEVSDIKEIVGSGTVGNNGLYSVDVIFDNELTPEDEGADEGDKLIWKIDGIPTDIPAPGEDTANSGGVNSNFNIFANSKNIAVVTTTTISTTTTSTTTTSTTTTTLPVCKNDISPELIALIIAILLLTAILLILLKKRANGTP